MAVKKKVGKKPVEKDIAVADLVFDEKYQMRQDLPSIDEYASLLEEAGAAWPFPPLVVRELRGKFYVLSGFTRGRAAAKQGRETVPCEVRVCAEAEAIKIALQANATHGYRRTNADKRKSVLRAYGRWPGYSTRKLAELCAVSHTYVDKLVNALKDQEAGDAIEFEPSEAEPETIKLDECPVCKANSWKELDDGTTRCAVCSHVHGEPAGTDELELVDEAKETIKEADEQASQPAAPAALGAKPSSLAGKVNKRKELLKRAETELGRFIRTMAEVGWPDTVEDLTTSILIAVKKAQKKC